MTSPAGEASHLVASQVWKRPDVTSPARVTGIPSAFQRGILLPDDNAGRALGGMMLEDADR